jgi:surfeit locus 1 family protein
MTRASLFWPSLWAGFGFLLLIGLGTWQLQRLHWKEGLIAERQAGLHAAAVALPSSLAAARALEFHPVRAEGTFLNAHEFDLNAQSLEGEQGFHIVTPLMLADGTALLVDRGFVPTDRRVPASREAGELQGKITVTGLLRLPEGKGWFTPDNDPALNSWFTIDIPAMAKAAGLAHVQPFYIDADATPVPGGWPKGGQTITALPNHHLQYAITWYSLAVALVVIYIRFARRRLGERR